MQKATLRVCVRFCQLSSIIANHDINTDWHQWKDTFLVGVSDSDLQTKRFKGRNPIPWMSGATLNLIKKKESLRQKLNNLPRDLRKTVKRMLLNSSDEFLDG